MTILTITDLDCIGLEQLLQRFGMMLTLVEDHREIPGSHWGDEEAGLIGNTLYVRNDTPAHSALHEACHYICMDDARRDALHTDAGGDYAEENAVCYLQIVLADYLPPFSQQRAFDDMDAWGYSFRLGSTRDWFEQDADDARDWLHRYNLIDDSDKPRWRCRSGTIPERTEPAF